LQKGQRAAQVGPRAPEEGERMSDKKKILVVDDSKTALFMVTTILRKTPYDVVTAHDGQEALDVAVAELPDLVLMDVVMPRKTGFEACRELKQREDTKHIPVILVTTRGEEENVESGFQSGCNDYVTKPVNAQELLAKVREHIAGPGGRR
jgi:DNA-binding response OmpR family regulator